jgi:hypothetical protein
LISAEHRPPSSARFGVDVFDDRPEQSPADRQRVLLRKLEVALVVRRNTHHAPVPYSIST